MLKSKALDLFGGTASGAAKAIGVTPSAVSQWPERLPRRIADRVLAALAREHMPEVVMQLESAASAQQQAEATHG